MDLVAGDFNIPPDSEYPEGVKSAIAAFRADVHQNRFLDKHLVDFVEVDVNGPTRVQRLGGHAAAWTQLDRVKIRWPEADIADAEPSAKVLYQSRLITGKVSDHVPIRLISMSDREGSGKFPKIPHWAAKDVTF